MPSTTIAKPPIFAFEDLIATAELPPPGPEHFYARRALWCKPSPTPTARTLIPHLRLQNALSQEGAVENDQLWRSGLKKVWESLTRGVPLKAPLPLDAVIKILIAGWIRDGTWPRGSVAPEPDDVLPNPASVETPLPPHSIDVPPLN